MTRPMPHRPARPVARAAALTMADDLTVISRLECVLRAAAAADRTRNSQAPAIRRLADWVASMR